jgi:hypothetical protein
MPEIGPWSQDVLTRIYNVQWGGGAFSFAGNIFLSEVSGGNGSFEVVLLRFSWLGGVSSDGEKWQSGGPTEAGFGLFCCVGGKVGKEGEGDEKFVTVAAGSIAVGPIDLDPGYAPISGVEPAAGVSYDGGRTWENAGLPLQQFILQPPDPTTGAPADSAQGSCRAVAYHPATRTFYVGASLNFHIFHEDDYWEDRMYRSESGSGFSQVYSDRREPLDPFPGYKWPKVEARPGEADIRPEDRLRVADMSMMTPSDPNTILFVVSFGPSQYVEYTIATGDQAGDKSYVSVNVDGTGVIVGGKNIKPPMVTVNSVCGGMGHIVAVGMEDESGLVGPVVFVSADDGSTWVPRLSELKHTNPGRDDRDSGSSGGACSFSPESSAGEAASVRRVRPRG